MYYPKSQVKPNLYTNGGEYILSTTKEDYKGYYYEVSNGEKYTGQFPQDGPNILLIFPKILNQITPQLNTPSPSSTIILDTENSILLYSNQTKQPQQPRFLPQFNPTLPTEQDKQKGQFTRYFCKKTNENIYLEIDQNTYKQLVSQDPKIAWDLYNPTQITWIIKGDKTQVYTSNKGSVTVIEQQKSWYGFTQWFKDKFLQYYLES
jgi:hypothetical protein